LGCCVPLVFITFPFADRQKPFGIRSFRAQVVSFFQISLQKLCLRFQVLKAARQSRGSAACKSCLVWIARYSGLTNKAGVPSQISVFLYQTGFSFPCMRPTLATTPSFARPTGATSDNHGLPHYRKSPTPCKQRSSVLQWNLCVVCSTFTI
jgi:hypothetical protein